MKKALTLTIICNNTSNFGESLGQISEVQKFYKNGKTYSMRSKESMKYAIMEQSGLYNDLQVTVDKVAQKEVSEETNISNCKALEGGYMKTSKGKTYVRNSSFYLTDAVSCNPIVTDYRFHNNLNMAKTFAKQNGKNLQKHAKESGLMPYNYEFEKNLKKYSVTIDLEAIGVDEEFSAEAENSEKANRVNAILNAIKNLSLVVKGSLDNSEPIFIVGGLSEYKTHYFENCVNVKNAKLVINDDLINRLKNYKCALVKSEILENQEEIVNNLNPIMIEEFFEQLFSEVNKYYGV